MQLLTSYLAIITFIILFMLGSFQVSAQTEVFVEDFSQSLSKWQPLRDDGRYWQLVNNALEAYVPFQSTITELVPIVPFPSQLDAFEYRFDMTPLTGVDKNISFGIMDVKNWYEIHFAQNLTELVKLQNNLVVWSYMYPYVLLNGKTYDIAVRFIQGHITLFINNQEIFSKFDPGFVKYEGKIGLKASTGSIFPTRIRFDNIRVTALTQPSTDTHLDVPLIKQTDPQWAELEYDSAKVWASATAGTSFKAWACNLISQVMLLRYHGITQLPDGTELTPVTFNTWLLTNRGYLNSPYTGNINRISITQLSAAVSQSLGTPKLEFQYVNENMIARAIEEIERGNPVILELKGHFVIADGYTEDKSDLFIKDPAYSVQRLSAHPLSLVSVRLYTPSQTDLSYLSIVTDPHIAVALRNSSGDSVAVNTYHEQLTAFASETTGPVPTTKIIEIPKPENGTYHIIARSGDTELPGFLAVETYQSDGQSQLLYQTQQLTSTVQELTVHFDKTGKSTLENSPVITFETLRQAITELRKPHVLSSKAVSIPLLQLTDLAEAAAVKRQYTLLSVMKRVVQALPSQALPAFSKVQLISMIDALLAQSQL